RLVMLSITGFGQAGPESGRQAYAPVIHAESGLIRRQADFDGAWPSDPALSIADTNAGLHGLVAVLAALRLRDRTGQGQHIDLAWAELPTTEDAVASVTASVRGTVAEVDDRGGGRRAVVQSPYRFSHADSGVRGPAPHRGEHNTGVLADWLGMRTDEIQRLVE